MNRVILHIDMNSYFATVEQQANPLLRGKPIAVSGRPNIHSVVATASYEAKAYGVRAGMSTHEAKKLCPNLIFIPGDPNKYIDITGRLIRIFKSYTPIVEVFSIDEVFLDLTSALGGYQQMRADLADSVHVALEIKNRIKNEIGSHMTCSIGIAKNKFLAKLASEKKKPDGLTVIDESNVDEMLSNSKLDDFCGIGRRILKRLNDIGIPSVARLREIPVETLVAAFGNVSGHHLHNMAFGIDDSPVIPDFESEEQKSFGHSLTLSKETDDRHYVEAILLRLSEKVARRMRAENFCGKVVSLYVRFPDTRLRPDFAEASAGKQGYGGQVGGTHQQKLLSYYTDDGGEIFEIGRDMMTHGLQTMGYGLQNKLPFKVRMLSIGAGSLIKKNLLTSSLLPEKRRAEKIVSSMDSVNNFFGENTVFRAATLAAFEREKNVAGIRTRLRFQ